jgi:hypothetical protein
MANIEEEPIRLAVPGRVKRHRLPIVGRIALPEPRPMATSFILSLARRRSAEEFVGIDLADLATWLYYCSSVQSVHSDDPNRQQRFVPSFGGLHPAHILIGDSSGKWFTYISDEHSLGEVAVQTEDGLQIRNRALQVFGAPEATLVALLSDLDLAANYYENVSCLVLRDAGVLFGHGALVAAALGISFRILGLAGNGQIVRELPFRTMASGLAWIGGRQSTS